MRTKGLTLIQKRQVAGLAFVSPWLVGFLAFFLLNFIRAVIYSFNKIVTVPGEGFTLEFVGLRNYVYAFTQHATFNKALFNNLADVLVDVPLIVFFSLFMAILLNRKFKGRTLVRAIFFFPVILSSPVIMKAMETALNGMSGGMQSAVAELQPATASMSGGFILDAFTEFGMPKNIIEYIAGAVERLYYIIKASGVQILLFLAALQSIPRSLYEVSDIEGATAYEAFWKITFPMVSPIILTNVVYTIVDSFSNSEVLELSYTTAFKLFDFGLSATFSTISSLSVSLLLAVICFLISRRIFYQN